RSPGPVARGKRMTSPPKTFVDPARRPPVSSKRPTGPRGPFPLAEGVPMVRSAAAILAVLILPGLAPAQAPERSHTVVDDDTLWDLAVRYYENPWEWRTIWEANRSQIQDPNLIYPNQVFVIPGLPAQQQTAQATPAPAPATPPSTMPAAPPPMREGAASGPSAVHPADVRTIFYQNEPPAPSVVEMLQRDYMAVEPDRTR